jgi:hypothetical protein
MIFTRGQKTGKATGAEGGRPRQFPDVDERKVYERPRLRKPTRDQATLLLVGHAYIGDTGAKELLELLFPGPMEPT